MQVKYTNERNELYQGKKREGKRREGEGKWGVLNQSRRWSLACLPKHIKAK